MIGAFVVACLGVVGVVLPASSGDRPQVEMHEARGGIRVWTAEVEGHVIARASHCEEGACDLLLVVDPASFEDEDDDEGTGPAGSEGAASGDRADEGGNGPSADGPAAEGRDSESGASGEGWAPPSLIHLHLGPEGGEVHLLSPALPVAERVKVELFDVTAVGAPPRAVLRLGGSLRIVPFRAQDRASGSDLAGSVLRLPRDPDRDFDHTLDGALDSALDGALDDAVEVRALAPGSGWIGLFEPGHLELVSLDADGATTESHDLALPFEVRRRGRSLTLESPLIQAFAGDPPSSVPEIVVGPQASGSLRLRTLILDPAVPTDDVVVVAESVAGDESGRAREMWSALPAPETVRDREIVEIAGARYLIVSTTRADKLSMLERKKLRLWELTPDRTRAGAPPLAEILTASRHWQDLRWSLADVTADGVVDLVLLQPEGLGGQKLAVDLYVGRAGGGFERRKIRSMVKSVPSIWRYGRDLTGDGLPDLLLASRSRVEVRAGRLPDRRGLLEEEPVASWSSSARVSGEVEDDRVRRSVAVEGELLLLTRRARGRTVLEVVAFERASSRAASGSASGPPRPAG